MTGILSSISGYFSKSLILGTFLPVVVFIVLSSIFLVPLLPPDMPYLSWLANIDKEWRVVALSFVAIVLSGLLYNLNIPLLRTYEGYPWQASWIGKTLKRRHVRRFEAARYRIEAARVVLRLMKSSRDGLDGQTGLSATQHESLLTEVLAKLRTLGLQPESSSFNEFQWSRIWRSFPRNDRLRGIKAQWAEIDANLDDKFSAYRRQFRHSYPEIPGLILPTRLGNVIRSFEYYSHSEYNIDSIELWPRLVAVIPKDYAVSIDDAKTTFDFMMNLSALSLLLAFAILLAGLIFPASLVSATAVVYWLIEAVIFVMVSYLFYRLSINRAGAWGSLVKGSFDLYRWELLKNLGFKQTPESRTEERRLWGEISRQMIYGDRFDKALLGYAEDKPAAFPVVCSAPGKVVLEVSRGISTADGEARRCVHLQIKNPSGNLSEANITVTDKLSDGFDYEWDSARINNEKVPVTGTNPYIFSIGHLLPGSQAVLTYCAVPRKSIQSNPCVINVVSNGEAEA